jgi:polysaccharide deacetylase family protein (PEP-CTERM system associated)
VQRSRDILEGILGERVTAYRAPSFSITKRSLWALEILVEEGFCTDSSVFPVHHDRYGIPGAKPRPHQIRTPAGALWEFPPSVARFAGFSVPVGGGGYFRLFPLPWTAYCLARINRTEREPFVFYIHPWELDPEQPRIAASSRLSSWRDYLNLSTTKRKLHGLLPRFSFGRLCDAIEHRWRNNDRAAPVAPEHHVVRDPINR